MRKSRMTRPVYRWMLLFAVVAATAGLAKAEPMPAPGTSPPSTPEPYAAFTKTADVMPGLIGIVRKDGKVYLSLEKSQLGKDFIETSIPATGLGGLGPAPGEPYIAPARIIHFERVDDNVIIRWPNTIAKVDESSPQAAGARLSLANSIVAVTPVVAQSDSTIVISAAPFLGDIANLQASFDSIAPKGEHAYRLDATRTYLSDAKSFPQNTLLRVSQTWTAAAPDTIDNAPDPRSIEVKMSYNLIAAPQDGYTPRIADPRVGFFALPLINFQTDRQSTRNIYYVTRWNFMPQHPGQPSIANNPIVFTLDNDVPVEYRDTVRDALLAWNEAFARVGILNAIQVRQQPDDPSFDEDDIRENVVRWVNTSAPRYGAEALIVNDPRTGEEINVGVNVDAIVGLAGLRYRYVVAPARGLPDTDALERQYTLDYLTSVVLHEAGHDFGLLHNFIGSMAYSARQLQDPTFTAKYGIASSVMEYTPTNVWPKGTSQGGFSQHVLGPYDYYAIGYGYQTIANAPTPEAEEPTLRRYASRWSDPLYRFASDEDVSFADGHAIDPRVQQNDLTNKPLEWEQMQLTMLHGLLNAVDKRFPKAGESYAEARRAFTSPLQLYIRTVLLPAHVVGGEYLSRANAGDPNSAPPLTPVSRADELAAWNTLERFLFSDAAWAFSPSVLTKLTYSEVSSFTDATWAYAPTPRHDVPVVQVAQETQDRVLDELFAPLTLQRIDELSTKYAAGTTMTLTDLFDWTRTSIFGDLSAGSFASTGLVRRNAQIQFAKRLAKLWLAPSPGTPSDAQVLARHQLEFLTVATQRTLRASSRLDELTLAHLEALAALAHQALEAHATFAG